MRPDDKTDKRDGVARPFTFDNHLHELLSEADVQEVSREELDSFDDSSFDTAGVAIPPSMMDPSSLFELLDDVDLLEHCGDTQPSWRQFPLFGHVLSASPMPWELIRPDRCAALSSVVIRAFADVRSAWSADYTVLEPELNLTFLQRCWELGAAAAPEELNWTLINARKAGQLHGMPKAQRFRISKERFDECAFASEIAFRHLQDRTFLQEQRIISLDKLLCIPRLAREFDSVAAAIAPGFQAIEYRWAALSLRKARRAVMSRDCPETAASFEDVGETSSVCASRIYSGAGLFWFQASEHSAFVGTASNLRKGIDRVLQSLGPRIVPDWMDFHWRTEVPTRLLIAPMPGSREEERERQRSTLLKKFGSRLNFFINGLFPSAA